jgi:hypothetical protein
LGADIRRYLEDQPIAGRPPSSSYQLQKLVRRHKGLMTGGFWGGRWGLLFGAAFFAVPGIGPVLVAGPLVAWIVGALEGAVVVGGLSAIGAGLCSIGFPKDSVLRYDAALKADNVLLTAHGSADEVAKAKELIQETSPVEANVHPRGRLQSAGALESAH